MSKKGEFLLYHDTDSPLALIVEFVLEMIIEPPSQLTQVGSKSDSATMKSLKVA